ITFPVAATYNLNGWNAGCGTATTGDLCGTASDATTGVQTVQVSLHDDTANGYWNGNNGNPNFNGNGETFSTATPTATGDWSSWSLAVGAGGSTPVLTNAHQYTIHVRATDNAGIVETGPTVTFTYSTSTGDTTSPTVSSINRTGANPTNAASIQW